MKTAIVTGAGSGIGRATSLALLAEGYRVVLAGRRAEALEETRQLAGDAARRALVVPADVTDEASVDALFDITVANLDRVDLLFNNAGTNVRATPVDELKVSDWHKVLAACTTGTFLCSRAAFRAMKAQMPRGGRIINNGSISAHVPRLYSAPYTAAKHAVTGLTRALNLEGRAHDIAVGQIDIGNAETDMTARMKRGVIQADGAMAVEPTIDVDLVARAVVFMASLPLDANILFQTIMATRMPFVGRG